MTGNDIGVMAALGVLFVLTLIACGDTKVSATIPRGPNAYQAVLDSYDERDRGLPR